MSGVYTFYVGNCRGEQSQGYLVAKKFMNLLKKQKEVHNIKYEELPVDPKAGQTRFSFALAVRVSFDLR